MNKAKGNRSRVKKGYYERQFAVTDKNKLRRKLRTERRKRQLGPHKRDNSANRARRVARNIREQAQRTLSV